jgi:Arc/MetJ-type ribon-helix-helix transcriptional regulator
MTIHVSQDVENSIHAAVLSGQFASVDEMIDKLVREYAQRTRQPSQVDATPDPLLGIWHDYADEMDAIVADAMQRRKDEPWRVIPGE